MYAHDHIVLIGYHSNAALRRLKYCQMKGPGAGITVQHLQSPDLYVTNATLFAFHFVVLL